MSYIFLYVFRRESGARVYWLSDLENRILMNKSAIVLLAQYKMYIWNCYIGTFKLQIVFWFHRIFCATIPHLFSQLIIINIFNLNGTTLDWIGRLSYRHSTLIFAFKKIANEETDFFTWNKSVYCTYLQKNTYMKEKSNILC